MLTNVQAINNHLICETQTHHIVTTAATTLPTARTAAATAIEVTTNIPTIVQSINNNLISAT
jgi:hypothetical protein